MTAEPMTPQSASRSFVVRIRRDAILEIADEPLARFGRRPALARRVVLHLVEVDGPHREVPRLRIREVPAADRGRGIHGETLGDPEVDGAFDIEHLPQRAL